MTENMIILKRLLRNKPRIRILTCGINYEGSCFVYQKDEGLLDFGTELVRRGFATKIEVNKKGCMFSLEEKFVKDLLTTDIYTPRPTD